MSLLSNLKSDDSIQGERDSLGGGGAVDSGLYPGTVAMAYLQKSSGGALGLFLTLAAETGREIRQTLWVTSGDAKGNLNYYTDKDGKKQYLPGYLMANSLCLLAAGKEIAAMDTEEKVVKIYNKDAGAEVPTKVQVLVDLLDKPIIAGIIKQIVDKNIKDGNGNYVASGETREENEVDKFFRAKDRKTTAEILANDGSEAGAFIDNWEKKWKGQVRDKSSGTSAAGGTAGAPKKAAAAGASTKPQNSLFG